VKPEVLVDEVHRAGDVAVPGPACPEVSSHSCSRITQVCYHLLYIHQDFSSILFSLSGVCCTCLQIYRLV
jgi:hypothetical protein